MRTWSERVGYPLSKSNGREDRDAGLSIIAADVLRLSQDQLSILSPADWERRKSEFIHSTWVTRAVEDAKNAP
jgi:hypothetical protein